MKTRVEIDPVIYMDKGLSAREAKDDVYGRLDKIVLALGEQGFRLEREDDSLVTEATEDEVHKIAKKLWRKDHVYVTARPVRGPGRPRALAGKKCVQVSAYLTEAEAEAFDRTLGTDSRSERVRTLILHHSAAPSRVDEAD